MIHIIAAAGTEPTLFNVLNFIAAIVVFLAALAISVNLVADWIPNRTTDLKGGRGNA